MVEQKDNSNCKDKILSLETQIRHLTNELRLTREEYEHTTKNYFDVYSNMEKKVGERTRELKRLHKILETKNRQLQIMLDSSPVMIFYKDAAQKYIRVNKKFSRNLGVPVKKIVGRSYAELFPGNEHHIFGDDSEVLQTKEPVLNRADSIDTPEGQRQIMIDKIPYKDTEGNLIGIIGFAVDVTDLKKAEKEKRELQQRIARAEKMEAIGLLAGGVAHDGNNMLTGISGYLQLMKMNLPEDDPNREYIDGSLEASHQMGHLINDLLTLTRSVVTKKEVVNLNDIITAYLGSPLYQDLKNFHCEVTIETELAPDLFNIQGVPTNLTKTIMNLVTNAAEAMPDGGTVRMATRNQYVDKPINAYDLRIEDGDFVVLTVADSGIGIAAADLNRIFEPFYSKKVIGKSGTGLGMAVVYGIVKDHEGIIDVQSIEAQGTTFEIYFPITKEEISKTTTIVPIDEYLGNEQKILVVDDIKAQRQILSEILTQLGYEVETVSSGEEAVEYMKEHSADLLILDMIMDPGIDGLDTYKKILELHPGQKAIIASGYSKTERVKEAQKLGAGQYVKKPYTFEKIGMAVRAELDK